MGRQEFVHAWRVKSCDLSKVEEAREGGKLVGAEGVGERRWKAVSEEVLVAISQC